MSLPSQEFGSAYRCRAHTDFHGTKYHQACDLKSHHVNGADLSTY